MGVSRETRWGERVMGEDSHNFDNQGYSSQSPADSDATTYPATGAGQYGYGQESSAPMTGDPTQAYGQPAYGAAPAQYPYQGDPQFNGQPQDAPKSNSYSGMAITALVLAFLLPLVGLILAIISLVKFNKGDRRKGKGMSIAALVISIIMMIGSNILVYNIMNKTMDQVSHSISQSVGDGSGANTTGKYKNMQDWIDRSPDVQEFYSTMGDQLEQQHITATLKADGDEKLVMDLSMELLDGQEIDSDTAQQILDQPALNTNMTQLAKELKNEGFKHPTVEVVIHTADNSFSVSQVNDENGKVS